MSLHNEKSITYTMLVLFLRDFLERKNKQFWVLFKFNSLCRCRRIFSSVKINNFGYYSNLVPCVIEDGFFWASKQIILGIIQIQFLVVCRRIFLGFKINNFGYYSNLIPCVVVGYIIVQRIKEIVYHFRIFQVLFCTRVQIRKKSLVWKDQIYRGTLNIQGHIIWQTRQFFEQIYGQNYLKKIPNSYFIYEYSCSGGIEVSKY
eukprot:TRINITY_DN10372_c0_g1_i3.p2 TRINITY_DN10372_c0_g1~~TRINITY_DN10372_c0_g1_i3.p2  ORF type:complete len:203 (-),score=-5.13 TRINITY_DN10372_c0_g1_i3:642-1250(-)